MAEVSVTRLLPPPSAEVPLAGLYLADRLHERHVPERAFVYTNFISSVDGRISVGDDAGGRPGGVPAALANRRDWRLYQELALQADVIVTSGRYLREFAAGDVGPIFTHETDPAMADLRGWRDENGLSPLPAVAVVSRGLTFDAAAAGRIGGAVVAIGAAAADTQRVSALESAGVKVALGSSPDGVSGREIAVALAELGYRTAFSAAGPQVTHLFVADSVLDALYVTQVTRLLGGRTYVTLDEGRLLPEAPALRLVSLHLDPAGPEGASQLFAAFELPGRRAGHR